MISSYNDIYRFIKKVLEAEFPKYQEIAFDVERSKEITHGDYASNVAFILSKKMQKKPHDVASVFQKALIAKSSAAIERIEIAGPGFLNFFLKKENFEKIIEHVLEQGDKFGNSDLMDQKKILVEFAHPNTHKTFHIGHLRNICIGEACVRIFESQGARAFRANYQGDIGLHAAKFLWAYQKVKKMPPLHTPQEKTEFLGEIYAKGGKAYERDEKAREEIEEINRRLYQKDHELLSPWKETRQWSLDYFEHIYKRLGTRFDRLFFESEVYELGLQRVDEGMRKGIFEQSDGAIIFHGEKYGLHTRVFVTRDGHATYEGKEMGLAELEMAEGDFDLFLHVVANEQAGYFCVVIKAMELLYPQLEGRQKHLSYGIVKLPSGKMSSRTGDVIPAEFLIEEARKAVDKAISNDALTRQEKEEVIEKVAIGAIKFVMLHTTAKNDIVFDLKHAVQFEGDTGPYIQYSYARIKSILRKIGAHNAVHPQSAYEHFNDIDWMLARELLYFENTIRRAAQDLSPHHITHYLLEIAATFSQWYDKNRVIGEAEALAAARIRLITAVAQVIKNGLYLLGISVSEKM